MSRSTGRSIVLIIATVSGATWLFKKAGLSVPGFRG